MIIVRTPLRISLAGGGTDLPTWYRRHGSMFISASINKYIYITLQNSSYNPKINLRYSELEEVEDIGEIKNDILRETLKYCGVKNSVAITSHADIPSGTGLGSSGSFGVAVLHALKPDASRKYLARISSKIQMDILDYPIGWQDQYVAAYGGINSYHVNRKGVVRVNPFKLESSLAGKLVMFFTGFKRDTNPILSQSTAAGLGEVQELAWEAKEALETSDLDTYGLLLDKHWQAKKKRNPSMSNPEIDSWYELGLKNGALGGKLIGAGGGGFLMFYTNHKEKLIGAMPLQHEPFRFDREGSRVIYHD